MKEPEYVHLHIQVLIIDGSKAIKLLSAIEPQVLVAYLPGTFLSFRYDEKTLF